MHSASERHPVEYLFDRLQNISYPDGLDLVPAKISGTAFFPGGYGLWREEGRPLPPMPCGKVMVLGQDFGKKKDHKKALCVGHERDTPTWRNLLRLLKGACIPPQDCFFTNAYMGLRTNKSSTGPSPGTRDERFRERCRSFLVEEQIAVQEPKLILVLGLEPAALIASVSSDLAAWRKQHAAWGWNDLYAAGPLKHAGFGGPVRRLTTVVALLHPSGYNLGNNLACRRYRGYTGMDAELELLREANALAKGERSP